MARFATQHQSATAPTTQNLAGGDAFLQSPQMALASLALTSMVRADHYRSESDALTQLVSLLQSLAKAGQLEFAAKAALYARHEHGMRTISHVIAGELALWKATAGEMPWRRKFFEQVVRRPDDALEIAAYASSHALNHKLPNALKRGLAAALCRFSPATLAKYDKDRQGMGLVDLCNLVHPKRTSKARPEKREDGIHHLMEGTLRPAETWEHLLSEAGKDPAKKAAVWASLVGERKLGYMALLMNLRNIVEQASMETVSGACDQLLDVEAIRASLVLPTQFLSAAKAFAEIVPHPSAGPPTAQIQRVLEAISNGCELAMQNVPTFPGTTLIALDCSGSMMTGGSEKYCPFEIGTLFASVLYKANAGADFLYFSDKTAWRHFDRRLPVLAITTDMRTHLVPGGTNFHLIFEAAQKAYDRVVILSDGEAWMTGGHASANPMQTSLAGYRGRCKADPMVYSFDLAGHGTTQFTGRKALGFAGFSDKVFALMKALGEDREALVRTIEAYRVAERPTRAPGAADASVESAAESDPQ